MKPQEWNDGLNHLDQDLVEEYIEIKEKKRKPKRPFWMATVAATLVLVVGLGMLASSGILPMNGPSLETLPPTQSATNPTGVAPTAPSKPIVTNPPTVPDTVAPTTPLVPVVPQVFLPV